MFVIDTHDEQLINILHICCEISQRQPVIKVFLMALTFSNSPKLCSLKLSNDIVSFMVVKSFVQPEFLLDLLDQVSESSTLHTLYLYDTSLAGSRSLGLKNKVMSLSTFALAYVVMDKSFCENLLRQTMFLNNLKRVAISRGINEKMIMNDNVKSGLGEYCEIPSALCSEFLRTLSNFKNLELLDLSGNNLTGCLSNFIPEYHSGLPKLENLFLNDAALNVDDLEHITHLIQDNKIPNMKELRLDNNNFKELEDTVGELINALIQYERELRLSLLGTNLSKEFIEEWRGQCKETNIELKG